MQKAIPGNYKHIRYRVGSTTNFRAVSLSTHDASTRKRGIHSARRYTALSRVLLCLLLRKRALVINAGGAHGPLSRGVVAVVVRRRGTHTCTDYCQRRVQVRPPGVLKSRPRTTTGVETRARINGKIWKCDNKSQRNATHNSRSAIFGATIRERG